MAPDTSGWSKAEMYVQKKLDEHTKAILGLTETVNKIDKRLAGINIKVAGMTAVGVVIVGAIIKTWVAQ